MKNTAKKTRKHFIMYLLFIILLGCKEEAGPKYIDGDLVPPMPDEDVNNSTVLGVDSDNDGLRDDVERLINKLGDNPNKRNALKQEFKYYQKSLKAMLEDDFENAEKYLLKEADTFNCAQVFFNLSEYREVTGDIRSLMVNTKLRMKYYSKLDYLMSGKLISLADNKLATCEFEIFKE